MKNSDLIFMYNQLKDLREHGDMCFPARISFAITHNMKQLEPIVSSYYNARDEVVQRYGEPDEQPGAFKIPKENILTVQNELEALDNTEVEVKFLKIKLEEIEKLELSIQNMEGLYYMLEE